MKKLLTAGLVVALSMFLATTAVAQKESVRKGYRGHKKQVHVDKHTSKKVCPKCVSLRKEITALKKRLAKYAKGKGKAKGKICGTERMRRKRLKGESKKDCCGSKPTHPKKGRTLSQHIRDAQRRRSAVEEPWLTQAYFKYIGCI